MLALITNDDGIGADGIQALARVARKVFDEVVIAAPYSQKSAVSHGITINKMFRIVERFGPNAFAFEALPSDCVFFALRELLPKPPDFVLSGVNLGPNMGYDTIYSGTVAGAREGLMNGIPSIAFSLGANRPVPFEQVEPVVERVLRHVVEHPFPQDRMLNVNIPSLEVFGPVKGYHMCSLGTRVFGNKTALVTDPMGTRHGWIGGRDFSLVGDEDSDCRWLAKGYVTLSLLSWGNSCLGKSEAGAEWAREVEDWLPNG